MMACIYALRFMHICVAVYCTLSLGVYLTHADVPYWVRELP